MSLQSCSEAAHLATQVSPVYIGHEQVSLLGEAFTLHTPVHLLFKVADVGLQTFPCLPGSSLYALLQVANLIITLQRKQDHAADLCAAALRGSNSSRLSSLQTPPSMRSLWVHAVTQR